MSLNRARAEQPAFEVAASAVLIGQAHLGAGALIAQGVVLRSQCGSDDPDVRRTQGPAAAAHHRPPPPRSGPIEGLRAVRTQRRDAQRIRREIDIEGPLIDQDRRRLLAIADRCPVHRTLSSEITFQYTQA
jgi:hypothetical protein